ncbi:hypothetical protein ACFL2U_00895 [Patescibacteria group bacterium]
MAEQFDIPEALEKGSVIEWIPRGVSHVNGYLKFYGTQGDVLLCQELLNGSPANISDYFNLVMSIAQEKGLGVNIPKFYNPGQRPQMPIRCTFVGLNRAAH